MRSTIAIITLGLLVLVITYMVFMAGGWLWHQIFIMMSVFLVFLTILSHQINLTSVNQQGRAVIIPYLISTVLKLLLSGVFLMVIIKLYPEMVKGLVIAFLTYYAAFSTLEIILVSRRTKGKKL